MAKRPPKRSDRTVRREQERLALRLQDERERLFSLERGGRPERPIEAVRSRMFDSG